MSGLLNIKKSLYPAKVAKSPNQIFLLNSIPPKFCHVITYHDDKKYPCPEGIELTRRDLIKMHFCGAQALDCHSIRLPTIRDRHKFLFFWHSHASAPHMSRETEWKEVTSTEYLKFHTIRSRGATLQIFTYWEYLNFSLLKKQRKYLLWEIDMKMSSSKGFEKFDSANQLFCRKQSFLVVPSWKY